MKLTISMLIMAAFSAGAPSSPLARTLRTGHAEDTLSRSKLNWPCYNSSYWGDHWFERKWTEEHFKRKVKMKRKTPAVLPLQQMFLPCWAQQQEIQRQPPHGSMILKANGQLFFYSQLSCLFLSLSLSYPMYLSFYLSFLSLLWLPWISQSCDITRYRTYSLGHQNASRVAGQAQCLRWGTFSSNFKLTGNTFVDLFWLI